MYIIEGYCRLPAQTATCAILTGQYVLTFPVGRKPLFRGVLDMSLHRP